MFHGVEAQRLSPPCWHVLDVATLRRQLDFVRRRFHVLPLDQALEQLRTGTLPDRAATVTFDDGTRNLATYAAPVLRSLGLPAAIFLATGPMGSAEALWPDRLWLAFANTTLLDVDLTELGLGKRSLRSAADRGEAYGLAVHSMKELPDEERITRLEALVAILGAERDAEPGPFQLLSWDEARA
ncbi:MAG: polysaccharide deacetylase family protein, partial [Actinomycetia bacterium]|nr:polysaccharide deacetylase family protein [Actinomycetes bacterium]